MGGLGVGTINIGTSTSDRITKLWSSDIDTVVLTVSSGATISGSSTIGSSGGGTVNLGHITGGPVVIRGAATFNSTISTFSDMACGNIFPQSNNNYKLGAGSLGFKYLYMTDQATGVAKLCYISSGAWVIT
jgi:hypothetical protein